MISINETLVWGAGGKETRLLRHFQYKNDYFTKTGSGQTYGKLKQRVDVSLGVDGRGGEGDRLHARGKKTSLFAPFIYKFDQFTKTDSGQT